MTERLVAERFVRDNTTLGTSPLVPEISLLLAKEILPLWRETEIGKADGPPPYWGFAWPGGQALARYILDHPNEVAGKSVLDFGSGSGIVAIAAAKSGALLVNAAEIDSFASAACRLNAGHNNVALDLIRENIIGRDGNWQTILMGDMCYERPLAEASLSWLHKLAAKGARVLLGDPGRNYFPDHGVSKLATYSVPTTLDLEDREIRETSIYCLTG